MSNKRQIQWFPGHMAKTLREIEKSLKLVDLVMIVLDARIPYSSMNPELLKKVKNKPVLILLNKADLSDPNLLKKWEEYYQDKGYYVLSVDGTSRRSLSKIYPLVKNEILNEQVQKRLDKDMKLVPFKTMILGVPNVGKSTIINNLSEGKSHKVENRPGVTKNLKWSRLSDEFELLDTPGVLWPKFSDDVKYNLAITGAIKDDILPIDDVCIEALKYLKKYYSNRLLERYQIKSDMTPHEMLDQIGIRFGALLPGKEIDYDRVYSILLKDIRSKKLGGLIFEVPR